VAEVSGNVFWRTPFSAVCNPKQLIHYTVMECEPIMAHEKKTFPGQGPISNKVGFLMQIVYLSLTFQNLMLQHTLADVWVVRSSELGINNDMIHTRSHLGHLLKPGDTALG